MPFFTYPLRTTEEAWGRATKDPTYDGCWQQHCLSLIMPLYFSLSFSIVRLKVLYDLPHFLFPSGAQVSEVLMFELLSIRRIWHIHFQRLPWIVLDSGIVAVLSYSCWFDVLYGQCIFKIIRRHFRWNVSSFSSPFSVALKCLYAALLRLTMKISTNLNGHKTMHLLLQKNYTKLFYHEINWILNETT